MSPQAILHDSKTALAAILSRIEAARKAALAPAPKTSLIAVSKTHGEAEIAPVLDAGQRIFGENYVQEAKAKWPALKERFPDAELHMIGPLQSNKAREAVELFDVIQSLDRESLAKELSVPPQPAAAPEPAGDARERYELRRASLRQLQQARGNLRARKP